MKGLKCTSYQLGYELTAVCGRALKHVCEMEVTVISGMVLQMHVALQPSKPQQNHCNCDPFSVKKIYDTSRHVQTYPSIHTSWRNAHMAEFKMCPCASTDLASVQEVITICASKWYCCHLP